MITGGNSDMDEQSQATYDTVMAFMGAMGSGDMETMVGLMADDMVWHNEGDSAVPWIGPWEGKEAILGFLGAGIPPEIPSWGNIMSEGRTFFQLTPWVIFFPGVALGVTVLAVNIVGDGLRDTLDPRIARNMR